MYTDHYYRNISSTDTPCTVDDLLTARLAFEPDRIEAHVFVAFLAYCLYVTLGRQLRALAPGLTARSALEKFAAVQMVRLNEACRGRRRLTTTPDGRRRQNC